MSNKPKDYESKLGPIPPEHFDGDLPFEPDVDKSEGSLYDHLNKRIKPPADSPKK